ncbi:MAG: hypothetical protein IT330_16845 [Anaerolineae bacterium]|nr:hypothetical protein [Anaerolineae bacterium]
MTAVTNSGPLITLAKLNHLHLLPALYGIVIVPEAVHYEAIIVGRMRAYPDAEAIRTFLDRMEWQPTAPSTLPPELTGEARLGNGEREAIALAIPHRALLLMDEVYARSIADRLGLVTVGSLGVLVEAFHRDMLTSAVFEELLALIESREDIWVHPDLCKRVRREILGKSLADWSTEGR